MPLVLYILFEFLFDMIDKIDMNLFTSPALLLLLQNSIRKDN